MRDDRGGARARAVGVALAILVAAALVLRAAKAHYVGILYDEAVTWNLFARSAEAALTRYDFSNNHPLNSLAIRAVYPLLGGYEHFVRVPALLCGAVFVLAMALCVRRTLADPWLRLAAFAAIAFHFFLFDMSYLARGYALALGATGALLAWLLVLEAREREGHRDLVACVPVVALLGFVAVGAMPSSGIAVAVLAALVFARRFARGAAGGGAVAAAALAAALLATAALGLLYRDLLEPILAEARQTRAGTSVGVHFARLLAQRAVAADGAAWLRPLRDAALLALAVPAAAGLPALASRGRALPLGAEKRLVVAAAGATALGMLGYGGLLGLPLGHPRNGIFLLPLAFLAAAGALEAGLGWLPAGRGRGLALGAVLLLLLPVLAWNRPSPGEVRFNAWHRQSVSGPLLRRLRRRDPDRVWLVGVSRPYRFTWYAMQYYRPYGYRFRRAGPDEEPDILLARIAPPGRRPRRAR